MLLTHEGDVDLLTPWSNVESIRRTKRPRHVGGHFWLPVDIGAMVLGVAVDSEGFAAHISAGTRVAAIGFGTVFLADGLLWTWLHLADIFGRSREIVVYRAR